MWDAVAGLMRK